MADFKKNSEKYTASPISRCGSILIDMGYEKTSLGLFKNFALIHSITFPVGINHVIKDISKVCSLSLEESEVIKNNINFSFKNNNKLIGQNIIQYLFGIFHISTVKRN